MARPDYKPTAKDRNVVKTLSALGCKHDDIATMVQISAKTLRKHFREELDCGSAEANAKVMQSLFEMATSGKNTAATIFWAKTRCGLREKERETADEGTVPQIVVKVE